MAFNETWDETVPAGTRALNLGDDDIRSFKTAIRERLQNGGMYFPSTDDSDAGEFTYVQMAEQSSDPTAVANKGLLYTKEISNITELFYIDSDGTSFQLTSGGAMLITSLGGWTARGDYVRGGASAWEVANLGASGTFMRSDGTDLAMDTIQDGDITAANANDGAVVQVVSSQTGAVSTGSTVMPYDDTIPQNTEGDQYMSLAITPNNASNLLLIEVTVFGSPASGTVGEPMIAALFQDATASALAAGFDTVGGNLGTGCIKFTYVMTAGTTSATTFYVRAGCSVSATFTFNGSSGGRIFGGVMTSNIIIKEIKV